MAAYASSYIPTTTASATRAADVLKITGVTGLDSAPISTFAEIELVGAAADERGIISVDNGATATNIAQYLYASSVSLLRGLVVSGGATQWDAGTAAIATDVTVKVAGRSATNNFNAASGGALTGSDASGSLSASTTQIRFGDRYWNGAKPIFGYLRRAAIWNRALTDSELTAVTSG